MGEWGRQGQGIETLAKTVLRPQWLSIMLKIELHSHA